MNPPSPVSTTSAGANQQDANRQDANRQDAACHLRVWCELAEIPNASFFEGQVISLSANGLVLSVPRLFAQGTKMLLTLRHRTGTFQCERQARVTHACRMPVNGWATSFQLLTPLSNDELRWFELKDFGSPRAG